MVVPCDKRWRPFERFQNKLIAGEVLEPKFLTGEFGLFACLLEIQGLDDIFLPTKTLKKYDVGWFESEKNNGLKKKMERFFFSIQLFGEVHPTFTVYIMKA